MTEPEIQEAVRQALRESEHLFDDVMGERWERRGLYSAETDRYGIRCDVVNAVNVMGERGHDAVMRVEVAILGKRALAWMIRESALNDAPTHAPECDIERDAGEPGPRPGCTCGAAAVLWDHHQEWASIEGEIRKLRRKP